MSLLAWFNKAFRRASAPETIRFTPRAKQLLSLARERARQEGRTALSVQDVSVTLAEFNVGIAAVILKRFGVDAERVRLAMGKASSGEPWELLLQAAEEEQRNLLHQYLGTEHLLLAVLRHDSNPLTVALRERGITLEMARQEVLKEVDPNFEPGA